MMPLELSRQFTHVCEVYDLDTFEAFIFCCAVAFYGDEGVSNLIDKGLITRENEHFFAVHLVNKDIETGKIVLRFPLFELPERGEFHKFMALLQAELSLWGHPENPKEYEILEVTKETQDAFRMLQTSLYPLDVERLARLTVEYYRKVVYCKPLTKFLNSGALVIYQSKETSPDFEGLL